MSRRSLLHGLVLVALGMAGLAAGLVAGIVVAAREPPDPEVADALSREGEEAFQRAELDRAQALWERSLRMREKALGAEHPDLAISLFGLAKVANERADYPRSAALYEGARRILLPHRKEHAGRLLAVEMGLAKVDFDRGSYRKALERLERLMADEERRRDKDEEGFANLLHNIGSAQQRGGDLPAAAALYERSLALKGRIHGPSHPDLVLGLNNLATVRWSLGDYAGARALYDRALEIAEGSLPEDHPHRAILMQNLAELLLEMGDHAAARRLSERVVEMQRRLFGEGHPGVAYALISAGDILAKSGDRPAATARCEEALRIYQRSSEPNSRELGQALLSLGKLRLEAGLAEEARSLAERAAELYGSVLGPRHYEVADALEVLADAHAAAGSSATALAVAERALQLRRDALGPDSPSTIRSLAQTARLLAASGAARAALARALEAETAARRLFRLTARTLSERQALLYARTRAAGLDLALALVADHADLARRHGAAVFDALVRSRALVLDELARRTRAASGGATGGDLAARLTRARGRLAHLAMREPSEQTASDRALFEEARRELDALEEEMARSSLEVAQERSSERVGLDEVRRLLPRGAALVATARVRPEERTGRPSHYLAFVLPHPDGEVRIVDLGNASPLEASIDRWRRELHRPAEAGGRAQRRLSADYGTAGRALETLLWEPIAGALDGARDLYWVPDGALHLVNPAALPLADGTFLLERGPTLHWLSAERDLALGRQRHGRGLLALGAASFEPGGGTSALAAGRTRGVDLCGPQQPVRFRALPETRGELDAVAGVWNEELTRLEGSAATELQLKRLSSSYRALHLATHGFLYQPCRPAAAEEPPEAALLRSGLALAGANGRVFAQPEQDDGLLTAGEVAALDLTGVEWAVLSACDSGLGAIADGEGVFGLRRAFQIAGVQSLVMSLWPVEDAPTRELMTALYRQRFVDGRLPAEALRKAELDIVAARRARGDSLHPFYWAPFIVLERGHG